MQRIAYILSLVALLFVSGVASNVRADEVSQSEAELLNEYQHVDPNNIVPTVPLKQALLYLKKYPKKFANQTHIGIIDYTQHASKRRFYVINLKTGKVQNYLTSHGRGSDPSGTGWARRFSNRNRSYASSVGFFRTGGIYFGKHGRSMTLEGLSSTNSMAEARKVVIHPANYVSEQGRHAGRSQGCPALDRKVYDSIINKLQGGTLLYAYGGANPKQF